MARKRKSSWQKEIDAQWGQFRGQAPGAMHLILVPVKALPAMQGAAAAGNRQAQAGVHAFGQWCSDANEALRHGQVPGCIVCRQPVAPGEIGCVAMFLPPEERAAENLVGLITVICTACAARDSGELRYLVCREIEAHFDAEIHMVQ